MPDPHLIQSGLAKAGAIKFAGGGLFAPALLLSFVGGMLVWHLLRPARLGIDPGLDRRLADLHTDNRELANTLQQILADTRKQQDVATPEQPTAMSTRQSESISQGKRNMLKRVLDDNLRLRNTTRGARK